MFDAGYGYSVEVWIKHAWLVDYTASALDTAVLGSPCSVPKRMSQKWHFIR